MCGGIGCGRAAVYEQSVVTQSHATRRHVVRQTLVMHQMPCRCLSGEDHEICDQTAAAAPPDRLAARAGTEGRRTTREPGRSANKRLQELAAHLPDHTVTAERTRAMAAFPPSSKPAEVLPFEGAWALLAGAPRPWSSTAQRGCGDASGRRPAPRATADCCSAPAGRPEGKPAHDRIAQWARRCHHVVVRHPCRDGTRAWVQLPWNTRRDPLPRGQLRSWRRHRTTSRLKSAHHRPGRPGRCCSHARCGISRVRRFIRCANLTKRTERVV